MLAVSMSYVLAAIVALVCLPGCAAPSRMGARSVTVCAEASRAPREPERPAPVTYAGASICVGFE